MSSELNTQHRQAVELHQKIVISAQLATQNIWDMCTALKEMRDSKLYKELGYSEFNDYCKTEFNVSDRQAYNYISIAENINPELVKSISLIGTTKLALLSALSEENQQKITAENDVQSISVRELQSKIKELKAANESLSEQMDGLNESVNAKSDAIKKLQSQNQQMASEIDELKSRPIEAQPIMPEDEFRIALKNLNLETEKIRDQADKDVHAEMEQRWALQEQFDKFKAESQRTIAEYEAKLAEAQSSTAPAEIQIDEKAVFKAYFTTAVDAFNRLLEFTNKTADSKLFHDKISALIVQISAANKGEN